MQSLYVGCSAGEKHPQRTQVMRSIEAVEQRDVVMCIGTDTWFAVLDKRPPLPHTLRVVGSIVVGNPGISVELHEVSPQGINPSILLLELLTIQEPGFWTQVEVRKQVRFEKVVCDETVRTVQILSAGDIIAEMAVQSAHWLTATASAPGGETPWPF